MQVHVSSEINLLDSVHPLEVYVNADQVTNLSDDMVSKPYGLWVYVSFNSEAPALRLTASNTKAV